MRSTHSLSAPLYIHVVDEWQRHLIHIGALVRQEAAILATLCDRTTWIHDATNSSAPMGG